MKLRYRKIAASAVVISTGVAFFTSPMFGAAKLALSYADPFSIAEYRLRGLTKDEYVAKIEEALSENDFDDAEAIAKIAQERGHAIDPALLARANAGGVTRSIAYAYEFAEGFAYGSFDSTARIAGTLASDLVGFGDIRDVVKEGYNATSGGDPDWITLAFATFGLTTSAMTLGSLGTASPVSAPLDMGASVLKTANKTRRLTVGLRRHLSGIAAHAVDKDALKKALGSNPAALVKLPSMASLRKLYDAVPSTKMSKLELERFQKEAVNLVPVDTAALKKRFDGVLRPEASKSLASFGASTAEVAQSGGVKSAFRVLSHAENPKEIARFAKLSEKAQGRTSSIIRLLGRKAISVAGVLYKIVASVMFLIFWVLGGIWTAFLFMASVRTLLRSSP
ncbi:hypothetical protein GCM10019059_42350 [Camelimonas fluminis]|uniref:Transcriptional regulator n=1 Tax=Camelimonas fluminis TaxID=1576911 RepID=A0ABV7UHB1_9HYPH|nr:hypothetical protein [Camelimonas fluminis]GHE79332.1 hypothetical protein GCM10019059_42350 [Camelimonas fluminis]